MLSPSTLELVLPWALAIALAPAAIRLAHRLGCVDRPGGRKAHGRPVALLGGAVLLVSIVGGTAIAAALAPPVARALAEGPLATILAGAAAMAALGLVDDLVDLSPGRKLAGQLAIAVGTWAAGVRCGAVELPGGWVVPAEGIGAFLVTVGWIVVVSNAFNLVDGLDGLAAGIGLTAALTLLVIAWEQRATGPVLGAAALAGALGGLLRYNLPPARIFLGDSGALAIGYLVATISIASYQRGPTAMVIVVPFLALGVPLVDVAAAIVRRSLGHWREAPGRRVSLRAWAEAVMRADRAHVHDLLVRRGWSVPRVVYTLYVVSAALGFLAVRTRESAPAVRWAVWLLVLAAGTAVLLRLERAARGGAAPTAPGMAVAEPPRGARP